MTVMPVDWVLLDIEGTTSSLSFVHEVMFPYARERMEAFLQERGSEHGVCAALEGLAREDAGAVAAGVVPGSWRTPEDLRGWVAHLHALMDRDAKVGGLKALQGMIWEGGFRDGTLRAHVFADVPVALDGWSRQGVGLGVYSSGSVAAQKLFFAHTIEGDLAHHFSRHFDTEIGGKREATSYRRIAQTLGQAPDRVLFVSDVAEELDAAAAVGLRTALAERPGNRPVPQCLHPRIGTLTGLRLERTPLGA